MDPAFGIEIIDYYTSEILDIFNDRDFSTTHKMYGLYRLLINIHQHFQEDNIKELIKKIKYNLSPKHKDIILIIIEEEKKILDEQYNEGCIYVKELKHNKIFRCRQCRNDKTKLFNKCPLWHPTCRGIKAYVYINFFNKLINETTVV